MSRDMVGLVDILKKYKIPVDGLAGWAGTIWLDSLGSLLRRAGWAGWAGLAT